MPNNPASGKYNRWSFTLNNYEPTDEGRLRSLVDGGQVRYIVFGREIGENQTPHLQGYLELQTRRRLNGVKELLGNNRYHLERSVGSATQNRDYCTKDGEFEEFGTFIESGQGRRTDLAAVAALVTEGHDLRRVAEDFPVEFIKYHRGIERLISIRSVPRSWRTQVVYFYGPTGSGKSRRAQRESQDLCPDRVSWLHDPSLKWFNGLDPGHKGVIIDDFSGGVDIALLLRLFDRYPMQVPVKGGFMEWSPRIVWITSNFAPEHWYPRGQHFDALMRRIDEITFINIVD